MDEIRCDEQSYLIWKWHPTGTVLGKNHKENSIRWGSSLRVKDGEVAIFVHSENGQIVNDAIVGPFDEILKTSNLPLIANIVGLAYDGGTPFPAEVYFINLAHIIQAKFGVPFFDVYDPRFVDFGVPVAVRGTISFKIDNYQEFIKLHRLINFDINDLEKQIRDAVIRYVKDVVANAPATNNIPLVQIETKTSQINDVIELSIKDRFFESFGVTVTAVDIGAIEIDKSSEGYHQLMAVTKDVTETKIKAETTDYVERLRIQREEGQYAQHKATQSSNFAAYQVEAQTEVGVAGANALGQMGANGAGGVDLGGNGAGFNPAAMMAGMALGGAVGQNIAGTMNGMMSGMTPPQAGVTPPPIPTVVYHVAVNGQATGPFNINTLQQMASTGQLTAETLVWKSGMAEWVKAGDVEDLKNIIANIPPVIPVE